MTRILFWNIQKYTEKSIKDLKTGFFKSHQLNYILQTLNNPTHSPDIFVLIELPGGPKANQGTLVTSGGGLNGIAELFKLLNPNSPHNLTWDLVPPIVTGFGGRREGIVVFFKPDCLEFKGPWFFNPDTNGTQASQDGAGTYDGTAWNIPGSSIGHYGGQWDFQDENGDSIEFPRSGERRPWRTLFQEKNSNRFIDVISFHAPFGGGPIEGYEALSTVSEVTCHAPENYVKVLGGDFNIDIDRYFIPQPIGYKGEFLSPLEDFPPQHCKTSIKAPKYATVEESSYPHYAYAASLYDQIFTKYGDGSGQSQNAMVLNPIVSTDIHKAGTGTYGYSSKLPSSGESRNNSYPSLMEKDLYTILHTRFSAENAPRKRNSPAMTSAHSGSKRSRAEEETSVALMEPEVDHSSKKRKLAPPNEQFMKFENYGKIRKTSDHLGVMIEV